MPECEENNDGVEAEALGYEGKVDGVEGEVGSRLGSNRRALIERAVQGIPTTVYSWVRIKNSTTNSSTDHFSGSAERLSLQS